MKIALDHIGYLGRSTDAMKSVFQTLGFQVNGPATLQLQSSSRSVTAVQSSAHIMFEDHYIELTSVNPCPPSHHLAAYQDLDAGIRLLVLRTSNIDEMAEKLAVEQQGVTSIQHASRKLTHGQKEVVRFRWLGLSPEPLPGVLTGFVQHLDAHAVFQRETTVHPNSVIRIEALHSMETQLPAVLKEGQGHRVQVVLGESTDDDRFFSGVDFAVADIERCQQLLIRNGVRYGKAGDFLVVPPSQACGSTIRFRRY